MSSADPTPLNTPERRPGPWRRHGIGSLLFSLLLAGVLGVLIYVLIGRPVPAPDWVRDRIAERAAVSLAPAQLQFDTLEMVVEDYSRPSLRMTNVRVVTPTGAQLVGFAEMRAGLSLPHLFQGRTLLSEVSVSGIFATLRRRADGSVAFSGGYDLAAPAEQAANIAELIERLDNLFARPGFEVLTLAEVQALTLRIEDERADRAWTIDGGRARIARDGEDLRLTADLALLSGGQGVATLNANYESRIGSAEATFGATVADVDAGDVATLAPPFAWLDVLRAPISGAMRGGVAPDGGLRPLSVTFSIGAGVIQPTDATRPVPFRSARSYFTYDPVQNAMLFDELSVVSDWITGRIEGQTVLSMDDTGGLRDLVGQFRSSELIANPADLYAEPIAVDAAQMDFRMRLDPFQLEIGQMLLEDQGQALLARGTLRADPEGWRYALDAQMDGLAPDRLFDLWPENFIPPTRAWLVENLLGGQMRDIDLVLRDGPNSAPDTFVSFAYDDAQVRYLQTMPLITGASGSAHLLDDRFVITVDKGTVAAPQGGPVSVAGSSFIIPDVTVKGGAPAVVRLQTESSVEAGLSLLDQPPLNVMSRAKLSPDVAAGQLQAAGTLSLPLRKGDGNSELIFNATGTARQVSSTTLIEGRTLAADTLRIAADNAGVTVSGPGTLDAVPFDVVWQQPLGGDGPQPSTVEGTIELSQRAITAFDIGLPDGMVTGSGTGRIQVQLPVGGEVPTFTLGTDLRGLRLSSPPLGWQKAAGTPGRLSVAGALGPTPRIDTMTLETPGLSATGSVALTENGGLARARFTEVRVGDWLRAPVDLVGRGRNAPPGVEVQGGTLDLRKADFGGASSGGAQGGGPLSLSLNRLQITDSIALDGVQGTFNMARGIDGAFTARVNGGTPVRGQILPQNGRSAIRVTANDAGGVFASAGLLKQARGGDLSLTLLPVGQASFDGTLKVQSTRVQDAPAIAALLNAASIVGLLEQLGGSGIHFQEVEAAFRLTPSTMALTRASAVGPSIGLSMDGTYDVSNKILDMQGVVSPIFLLNGLGSIFTRKGEGLIGFNYRLRGPVADPRVTVNPLSAFTPGMFREIFRAPPPRVPVADDAAPGTDPAAPEAFVEDPPAPSSAEDRLEERRREIDQR
ncbi:MAG: DUF3971 domain-containing protein [Pseudomonadota bacterium]